MGTIDRWLLNLVQGPFPKAEQPFLDLASQLVNSEEDRPLVPRPFGPVAERLGIAWEDPFELPEIIEARRIMRRHSVVLPHRRSGFRSGAMIVWKASRNARRGWE